VADLAHDGRTGFAAQALKGEPHQPRSVTERRLAVRPARQEQEDARPDGTLA
jgi:hypothetical protein